MILNILIAFVSLIALDLIWIKFIARRFYLKELQNLANIEKKNFKIKYFPALCIYLILAFGIVFFASTTDWLLENTIRGLLFGFVVYGVYDLTNYSILHDYSLELTLIDILWGTIICGASSALISLI